MARRTAENFTIRSLIKGINIGDTITYLKDDRHCIGSNVDISKLEMCTETVIAIDKKAYNRGFHIKSGTGYSDNIKIFLSNDKVIIISKLYKNNSWSSRIDISFGLDVRSIKSDDYDDPVFWNDDIVCINLPNFGWLNFHGSY